MDSSTEYKFQGKDSLLGAQMLFVAFGALVLVPILTGLDSNVALFTAGLGTLIFQVITRGKVPVFLASSFAFIAPISYGVKTWGIAGTMCGLAAAGLLYVALSILIKLRGSDFLKKYLPPVVTGPVIMVIGLVLAPVAVGMATGKIGGTELVGDRAIYISMAALLTTIGVSIFTKGFLRLIPILCGITAGYTVSLVLEAVNFSPVIHAPWFSIPNFVTPEWNTDAIFYIVPVAIAPAIEHFGDVLAIGSITGKDYLKEPGIDKTMMGDGIATSVAAFFGGPPNTTYSEVSGAVALTRAFNPAIMTWAAVFAILLSFVGKVGGFLSTIPTPVMGGIMILLFGMITVIGLNTLVRSGDNLTKPRNLVIVSLILVCGIGGMVVETGSFSFFDITVNNIKFEKIGLAAVIGIVLNLVLPGDK